MRLSRKTEKNDTLQELQHKVNRLEQLIAQLSRPVIEHITIERVYIQNPVLERLEFGLDRLDIDELSGSLNIGNNFGITNDKPSSKKQPSLVNVQRERSFTKESTQSGYRFRADSSKSASKEKE